MNNRSAPPMDPDTSEATAKQLDLAREQGEAYGRALSYMTDAVEEAEGMYEWTDGELAWRDPGDENVHVEVAVRDASDGRFVPGVRVTATLIDPEGNEIGTHEQPPAGGAYTMRVRVEPPTFMRHDEVNGRRFTEPVEVEFSNVQVQRGQDLNPS